MLLKTTTVLMFFWLSGCLLTAQSGASLMPLGASPLTAAVGAEAISVMSTKKTIGDHITSKMSGLDCSTPRADLDNGEVCRKYPRPPAKRPEVYCYRSLAAPDCYLNPSPNVTDVRIGYPHY